MLLNLLVGLNMALRPLDQEDPKMSTFIGAFVLVLRGLIWSKSCISKEPKELLFHETLMTLLNHL